MPWGEVVHAADGALRGESPDVDFEGRMELTQGKGCRSLPGIMGEQRRDTAGRTRSVAECPHGIAVSLRGAYGTEGSAI